MWWTLMVVVAAALFATGCVDAVEPTPPGDGDKGRDPPEVTEAVELAVDYSSCDGIEVFLAVPAASARPHVPDDFAVDDPALIALGGFQCGDDGALVGRGFLAIRVTPRDAALVSPQAMNHFWMPEHYVSPHSAIAEAFDAVGADMTSAEVTAQVNALSSGFRIEAENLTYRFTAEATGPDDTSGLAAQALMPFREYMAARGGYAYVDAGFGGGDGVTGVGPGVLEASGEAPGERLFGSSSTRGAIMMNELDYTNAKVGFVPWP